MRLRALIWQRGLQKKKFQKCKKDIRIYLTAAEKLRKCLKNIEVGHGGKEGSFKKHLLWKSHMGTFLSPCVFLWQCQVRCNKEN